MRVGLRRRAASNWGDPGQMQGLADLTPGFHMNQHSWIDVLRTYPKMLSSKTLLTWHRRN